MPDEPGEPISWERRPDRLAVLEARLYLMTRGERDILLGLLAHTASETHGLTSSLLKVCHEATEQCERELLGGGPKIRFGVEVKGTEN